MGNYRNNLKLQDPIRPLVSRSTAAFSTGVGPIGRTPVIIKNGDPILKQLLAPLDRLYPLERNHDLGPFVHWKGNMTSPMHRWLRYREAYSPELIDKLDLGDDILDPFSGCGSILIGAAARNKRSFGIDLNPIATFSSRVKLTPLSQQQLSRAKSFSKNLSNIILQHVPFQIPALSISGKVFEPQILDLIQRCRSAIEETFSDDPQLRDFIFLGWLAVLETVGSYFKEGNGIKYRNKKRQKGQYEDRPEGEWQLTRFGRDQRDFFVTALHDHLAMMINDADCWSRGTWKEQTVVAGNAFNLSEIVGDRRFSSIIFSPPYANRFDYFESFKVELWFGSFVNSYDDLGKLRKASLRSHLNADLKRPTQPLAPLEELLSIMDKEASSWKMGVPELIRGYFHDLRIVLKQCREVLEGGRCHVVVGNSAFAGVIIPTDVLTAMVGIEAGFKKARLIETRHLTVAPQQRNQLKGFEPFMRESIVVFE